MKYPRYLAYKDSGVEWIGEIPEHWIVTKLKFISCISADYGINLSSDNYIDKGARFVRITDINEDGTLIPEGVFIREDLSKGKILENGDLLFARSGSVGTSLLFALTDSQKYSFAGYLVRFRLKRGYSPSFVYLFSQSKLFKDQIKMNSIETTIENFNGDKYSNIKICLPDFRSQEQIVSSLGRIFTNINNLILKFSKMIELLKEKRQAIITKAVTKGLDPNMPMKDSGVEWIGEIPEHWDTIPIKFIMSCNDETLPESTHPETKIQYIEISDVSENQGITSIQEIKFSDAPSRARRIVKDGDIIISTVRTYLRAIATIKEPRENTVVSTGFAVLRSRGLSQKFAKYALSANYFIERIVSESTGVSYPAISSEKLMNFRIAIPDSKSQNYISDYIDKINGKLSQLISKQERMIELLKEYKTSLITQAGTGKIDVRGFAFPTDSKSA